MEKQQTDFNKIISNIPPPHVLLDRSLDAQDTIIAEEQFFGDIRHHLEKHLSHLALVSTLAVREVVHPAKKGDESAVSHELYIAKADSIAFALQTTERDQRIVRFGTLPLSNRGRRVLMFLEQADDLLSTNTF